ncbi:MAG: acyltransferase domain-containing protein [bacterium]|nr:acyltransferase domain-containing protein [bacterium]
MPGKPPTNEALRAWLVSWLGSRLNLDPNDLDGRETFSRLGLESVQAASLVADLAVELGRPLSPVLVWEHPTIEALASHLTDGTGDGPRGDERTAARTAPRSGDEPIAIIGMACRMPRAADPQAFWRMLCEGTDAITEVPAERWNVDAYYHPDPAHPETANARCGGFLDRIDLFDPLFFGISPREAEQMDPQQRLILELAWEALEDAGLPPGELAGSRTSVFVGAFWRDYAERHLALGAATTPHTGAGQSLNTIANRVSYVLGLRGPSMLVDTACSSSLVAVHLACQSLCSGESSVALVGGVHLMISPHTMVRLSKFGGLSGDGRCKAFDHRADGFGRGEGGGVVVLKPLARALAAGDRIYCVIRGSAVNNDGFSNGLTAPNPQAQEEVLRAAWTRAGVAPDEIHYVETHGTGTALGDPIEAQALGAARGGDRPAERPLLIGSVKTNIGHLEGAAGIAGLLKAALAVHHRTIPASLHFERPNPHIPFAELGLRVQRSPAPWPVDDEPARAGVSSFGWGGTNCHLVLEELPPSRSCLLPLSAASPAALETLARRFLELLSPRGPAVGLPELCLAAARELAGDEHRLALTGRSRDELGAGLETFLERRSRPGVASAPAAERPARVVFVCSPVGSQWCGMGRDLISGEPVFRATLERCDQLFGELTGWSLVEELTQADDKPRWEEAALVPPLVFAFQVAMAALWRSWGITPDAVLGHSLGEVTAAHLGGALALEEAVRIIYLYSVLLARTAAGSGLGLVQLPAAEMRERLSGAQDPLWIAGSNSPSSTLVAGDRASLDRLLGSLEPRDVYRARVPVEFTAHCPHIDPLLGEFRDGLRELRPRELSTPMISSVTATPLAGPEMDADYWARHLRQPVRFASAVEELARRGYRIFLQLDPRPVLGRAIEETLDALGVEGTVPASARRREEARTVMLDSAGALFARGHALRWQRLAPPGVKSFALPAAVMEDRDSHPEPEPERGSPVVVPLSARTPEALRDLARATAALVNETRENGDVLALGDLGYSAALRRDHHEHRLALVAHSRQELQRGLESWLAGEVVPALAAGRAANNGAPRVVFVFSGQGPQWWWAMGRELLEREPAFRAAVKRCDDELRRLADWSVLAAITAKPEAARLKRPAIAQPILFTLQTALVEVWRAWGIEADAVVGHSFGEVAAACAAGALSLEDAVRVAFHRGRVMEEVAGPGTMATVELPFEEVEELRKPYGDHLIVAAINAPATVVLAGESAAVEELVTRLDERGVSCWKLRANLAFHSPLMEPASAELEAVLEELRPRDAGCPIASSVSGTVAAGSDFDASYWRRNVRQPVRFASAIDALAAKGYDTFLEISTQPVLARAVSQCLEHRGIRGTVLTSMGAGREFASMLEALGALHTRGCAVDWRRLFPTGGRLVRLPTYPFQRRRYWLSAPDTEAVAVAGTDTIPASPPAAGEMDTIVASQLRAFNQLVAQQLEVLAATEPMDELGQSAPEPEASSG